MFVWFLLARDRLPLKTRKLSGQLTNARLIPVTAVCYKISSEFTGCIAFQFGRSGWQEASSDFFGGAKVLQKVRLLVRKFPRTKKMIAYTYTFRRDGPRYSARKH